jgi:hypothetical protein
MDPLKTIRVETIIVMISAIAIALFVIVIGPLLFVSFDIGYLFFGL